MRRLKRDGFDLNEKWEYKGTDPARIRRQFKSLGSDREIKLAAEAISVIAAVNFYGTVPVKAGQFTARKKGKYGACASHLLAKMPDRFKRVDYNLGVKVSLN